MLTYCLAIFLSTTLFAKDSRFNKVYLGYCSHYGQGVSLSFSSCSNSNFQSLAREIGGFYSYCNNIGDEVSYFFLSCMQSNFRVAEGQANGALYLQYCSNFDREALSYSYVSCVNSNFRSIENYVNNL